MSIGHLVQIYENAGVAMIELRPAGRTSGYRNGIEWVGDTLVQLLGSMEIASLVHQPLEDFHAAKQFLASSTLGAHCVRLSPTGLWCLHSL